MHGLSHIPFTFHLLWRSIRSVQIFQSTAHTTGWSPFNYFEKHFNVLQKEQLALKKLGKCKDSFLSNSSRVTCMKTWCTLKAGMKAQHMAKCSQMQGMWTVRGRHVCGFFESHSTLARGQEPSRILFIMAFSEAAIHMPGFHTPNWTARMR